jgi:hypothetical protein
MLGHEPVEIAAVKGPHPFRRPQDGAPQRLARIGLFLQPVKDDVIGRIGGLPDLLQDHAALHLDLARVEDGLSTISAIRSSASGTSSSQHAGVIGRHLAAWCRR